MQVDVELNFRPKKYPNETGDQVSLNMGIEFQGRHLDPYRPKGSGIRTLFVDEKSGLLIKAEKWGHQGHRESRLWQEVILPEHAEFFQPIYTYERIIVPNTHDPDTYHADTQIDYVVVPFLSFSPAFDPVKYHELQQEAFHLAALYDIRDWNVDQFKPVNQGQSFIIHDYGSGLKYGPSKSPVFIPSVKPYAAAELF